MEMTGSGSSGDSFAPRPAGGRRRSVRAGRGGAIDDKQYIRGPMHYQNGRWVCTITCRVTSRQMEIVQESEDFEASSGFSFCEQLYRQESGESAVHDRSETAAEREDGTASSGDAPCRGFIDSRTEDLYRRR